VLLGVDLGERVQDERAASLLADYLAEPVDPCLAVLERLRNCDRAIDELALGGEQRHVNALASQRPEREQRLESGDATTRNHYAQTFTLGCAHRHADVLPAVFGFAAPSRGRGMTSTGVLARSSSSRVTLPSNTAWTGPYSREPTMTQVAEHATARRASSVPACPSTIVVTDASSLGTRLAP
jgi:hypothetical protein